MALNVHTSHLAFIYSSVQSFDIYFLCSFGAIAMPSFVVFYTYNVYVNRILLLATVSLFSGSVKCHYVR